MSESDLELDLIGRVRALRVAIEPLPAHLLTGDTPLLTRERFRQKLEELVQRTASNPGLSLDFDPHARAEALLAEFDQRRIPLDKLDIGIVLDDLERYLLTAASRRGPALAGRYHADAITVLDSFLVHGIPAFPAVWDTALRLRCTWHARLLTWAKVTEERPPEDIGRDCLVHLRVLLGGTNPPETKAELVRRLRWLARVLHDCARCLAGQINPTELEDALESYWGTCASEELTTMLMDLRYTLARHTMCFIPEWEYDEHTVRAEILLFQQRAALYLRAVL